MNTAIGTRTTHTKHGTSEVVVVSQGTSKDSLISYINLMRHYFHLDPLEVNPALDIKARRQARYIKYKNAVMVDHDRSPFSVIKEKSESWVRPAKAPNCVKGKHVIMSPLSESPEYLTYILSYKCTSVGICTYETESRTSSGSFTVQVFSMEN